MIFISRAILQIIAWPDGMEHIHRHSLRMPLGKNIQHLHSVRESRAYSVLLECECGVQ